jgi:hypothetical protein
VLPVFKCASAARISEVCDGVVKQLK